VRREELRIILTTDFTDDTEKTRKYNSVIIRKIRGKKCE